jgi:hypothetical protein
MMVENQRPKAATHTPDSTGARPITVRYTPPAQPDAIENPIAKIGVFPWWWADSRLTRTTAIIANPIPKNAYADG